MKKTILVTIVSLFLLATITSQEIKAGADPVSEIPIEYLLSKLNDPQLVLSTKADDEFDVSTGWSTPDYNSDLEIPVDKIFLTGATRPGTNIHFASVNFANIGNAHFSSSRTFHLKANKVYHLKFIYGINLAQGEANGTIDFNGTKKTLEASDEIYEETVSTPINTDYVITMSFEAKPNSSLFLMVGYDGSDPDGGVDESNPVEAPTVEAPEAFSHIVEGKGEPGNMIKVSDSQQQEIGEDTVDNAGNFTVKTNRELRYNEHLSVTQLKGEYVSDPTEVTVVDTKNPEAPILNDVEWNDKRVTGTAEPLSTIKVKDAETGAEVGSGKANEDGKVDFELTASIKLYQQLQATAFDEASNPSQPITIEVIDTISPAAPNVDDIYDTDTHLKGNTHEGNCLVTALFGNQKFEKSSNENGDFDIDLKETFAAGTEVSVTAKDLAGNPSEATIKTVGTRKQTEPPSVDSLGDKDTQLTGTAEKNAIIHVSINEDNYETQVGDDGHFLIPLNIKYAAGTIGKATATGISGIESNETQFTVIDNTPPQKPILEKVIDTDYEIQGKSEPGSHIYLSITDKITGVTRNFENFATSKGDVKISIEEPSSAGSTIQCYAEDKQGNRSDITYSKILSSKELDLTLQDITTQDSMAQGDVSRAFANYKVQIFNRVYSGQADDKGHFEFSLDHRYEAGATIEYSAMDEEEEEESETHEAKVLPRTPTVDNVTSGQRIITGLVDPDAVVAIQVNNGHTETNPSKSDGSFECTLPAPVKFGDMVKVTQEKNGVTSREAFIYIGSRKK